MGVAPGPLGMISQGSSGWTNPVEDDALLLSISRGVAHIVVNRPAKRNAITQQMWSDLPGILEKAERSTEVGLIVIRGAGEHFISGADIDEYKTIHASRETTIRYLGITSASLDALTRCSKPTVAMIDGVCMGGGCLVALACDLRFSSDRARFCLPPSKLGLILPITETKRIVDAVGAPAAKDLIFSARVLGAPEALSIGLVNAVFETDTLFEQTMERIDAILANSQGAIRTAKKMIAKVLDGCAVDTTETRQWLRDALAGRDFAEGQAAFREKRPARFGLD